MLLPQTAALPKDSLYSKLLEVAAQRDEQVIVDDRSRGAQFGYRHILNGTVKLKQKLEDLLDRSTLNNRGAFFVALLAPNGYEFIVGVLAVLALGGVVVPMPTGALPAEATYIIQQCGACSILVGPEQVGLAAQIQEEVEIPSIAIDSQLDAAGNLPPATSYPLDPSLVVPEDFPSILFFTSGTTGPPKGVLHGRRTINKYAYTKKIEANDEICLIPRGAFWAIYFTKLFQMLLLGVRIEIQNFGRNYNLIWEKLREQTGTKIVLSATFWYGMMKHFETHISKLPEPEIREYVKGLQHLRDVTSTGAMLSGRGKQFWQDLRGGRPLKTLYGSTETQEICICEESEGTLEADLGTPQPNVVIKLSEGDEGEVLVKTPSLFLGYLHAPEATARCFDSEGFFKTGDLAVLKNGRYIFKGRVNLDMFKYYTYKVPRMQVEAHLTTLPYVSEGYILPVEDPQCDTRVAALVRFHDGADNIDLHTVRTDLSKDLPAYQLPTVLRVLREHEMIPRTWSDKVAMAKAIKIFFPQNSEDQLCGEATEILDISQFMKTENPKMWDLSGMR